MELFNATFEGKKYAICLFEEQQWPLFCTVAPQCLEDGDLRNVSALLTRDDSGEIRVLIKQPDYVLDGEHEIWAHAITVCTVFSNELLPSSERKNERDE